MKEIFQAILNIHKSLDSQRNDVVHGIWGFCPAITDGAVWMSVQSFASSTIDKYHRDATGNSRSPDDLTHYMAKDLFVYRISDLEAINSGIIDLHQIVRNFHC